MSYCTQPQVQELIARVQQNAAFSTTTVPTLAQATDITSLVAAEIDMHLSAAGIGTPVATPATLLAWLVLVNAEGAAARYLKSYAPESVMAQNGGAVIPGYAYYEKLYQDALALIDNRKVSLTGDSLYARTYLTDYPENDGNDGMTDGQEPVFSMTRVF